MKYRMMHRMVAILLCMLLVTQYVPVKASAGSQLTGSDIKELYELLGDWEEAYDHRQRAAGGMTLRGTLNWCEDYLRDECGIATEYSHTMGEMMSGGKGEMDGLISARNALNNNVIFPLNYYIDMLTGYEKRLANDLAALEDPSQYTDRQLAGIASECRELEDKIREMLREVETFSRTADTHVDVACAVLSASGASGNIISAAAVSEREKRDAREDMAIMGTSSGTTVDIVNDKTFFVKIFEEGDPNKPLSGVSMRVESLAEGSTKSETQTTGADGKLFFTISNFDPTESNTINVRFTLTLSGYRTREMDMQLKGTDAVSIGLEKDDGTPYVIRATFDGEDILSQENGTWYSSAFRDSIKMEFKLGNVKKGKLIVQLGNDKEKRNIVEKEYDSDDVITWENKWGAVLATDSLTGEKLYLRVEETDKTGVTRKTAFTVRKAVMEPIASSFDLNPLGSVASTTSFDLPIGTDLTGEKKPSISLNIFDFPVCWGFNWSGKGVVTVGKAAMSKKLYESRSLRLENFVQNSFYKDGVISLEKIKNGIINRGYFAGETKEWMKKVSVSVYPFFQGLVKWQLLSEEPDGKDRMTVQACIGFQAALDVKITKQMLLTVGPMVIPAYAGFDFNMTAGLAFAANCTFLYGKDAKPYKDMWENYDLEWTENFLATFRTELGFSVGLGIADIMSIGARGYGFFGVNLDFKFTEQAENTRFQILWQLTYGAGLDIEVKAVVVSAKIPILSGVGKLPPTPAPCYDTLIYPTPGPTSSPEASPASITLTAEAGTPLKGSGKATDLTGVKIGEALNITLTERDVLNSSGYVVPTREQQITGATFDVLAETCVQRDGAFFLSRSEGKTTTYWQDDTSADHFEIRKIDDPDVTWPENVGKYIYDFSVYLNKINTSYSAYISYACCDYEPGNGTPEEEHERFENSNHYLFIRLYQSTSAKPVFERFGDAIIESKDGRIYHPQVVSRSIYHPLNCEYAFMTMTEDGNGNHTTNIYSGDIKTEHSKKAEAIKPSLLKSIAGAQPAGLRFTRDSALNNAFFYALTTLDGQDENGLNQSVLTGIHVSISDKAYSTSITSFSTEPRPILSICGALKEYDQKGMCFFMETVPDEKDLLVREIRSISWDDISSGTYAISSYGIDAAGDDIKTQVIGACEYVYWVQTSAEELEDGTQQEHYYTMAALYDGMNGVISEPFVFLEMGNLPQKISLTPPYSTGVNQLRGCYFSEASRDSRGTMLWDMNIFDYNLELNIDTLAAVCESSYLVAGQNGVFDLRLKNLGNLAITQFDAYMQDEASNAIVTVHINLLDASQNALSMSVAGREGTLYEGNQYAVYRVESLMDNYTGEYPTVTREVYSARANANAPALRSTTFTQANVAAFMPGTERTFKITFPIPEEWEKTRSLIFYVDRALATVNPAAYTVTQAPTKDKNDLFTAAEIRAARAALPASNDMPLLMANRSASKATMVHTGYNDLYLDADLVLAGGKEFLQLNIGNYADTDNGPDRDDLNGPRITITMDGKQVWSHKLMNQVDGEFNTHLLIPLEELTGGEPFGELVATVSGDAGYAEFDMNDNVRVIEGEKAELPRFITNPADRHVKLGETATFTAQTSGSADGMQWYVNRNDNQGWVQLSGATGTSYTTAAARKENNGYRYKCAATRNGKTVESAEAMLVVVNVPVTADHSQPMLWLLAMLAGAAGLVLLRSWRKQR